MQAVTTALLNMCTKIVGRGALVHYGASNGNNDTAATAANKSSTYQDSYEDRLLKDLKQYGFSKKGLPTCAGGSFTSDR